MNTTRICKQCQAPLPADAPEGICPTCLMKAGLGTQSGAPNPSAGKVPPSTAELARQFPNLEILELLGQGGMGVVYKARQVQLDRIVALKILPIEASNDPAFAERFAREARALAKLNHPNIVAVYDFGRGGDYFFFVMEFVDGVNLRQMEQTQRLNPQQALAIVPKLCDALQYAHDEGVVHRDIKPGNILIDKKGRVKIADFGLAKLLGKSAADITLTQSNLVMGTPHYMAPEQMDKPLAVDHRADIYSLGVVFYEMLTGDLPIGRFSPPSAKVQLDVRLDEVVLKALENEPARRYQQASEVRTDVESIMGQVEKLPPTMRQAFGFDYRSKTEWFGLPLVHICSGTDPTTGKLRVAKGIIAIGDKAKGVLALGGVATGGIAFGGAAMGVFAIGGSAVGLFSFGGLTVALLFATGGIAIAPYSFGGIALGYVALGGLAFGLHGAGATGQDNVARQFYENYPLWRIWAWAFVLSLISIPVQFLAQAWARHVLTGKHKRSFYGWLALTVLTAVVCLSSVLAAPRLLAKVSKPARSISSQPAGAVNNVASTAAGIVRKMQATYESLMSFSATGKVVTATSITSAGTNMPVSVQHTFSIKLARPEFYRVEWTQSMAPFFTTRGAVWHSGKAHSLLLPDGKVSELLNRELALTMATGASGGAALLVPSLFFKDQTANWPGSLTNLTRLPDEPVEGVECYVISTMAPAGKEILWITKKDFLLKQVQSFVDGPQLAQASSQDRSDVSDASLTTILKAMGREATPEAISEMRKTSAKQRGLLGQISAVATQTFSHIAVNDLMAKDDFEYVLSVTSPSPKQINPQSGAVMPGGTPVSPSPAKQAEQPISYTFGGKTGFVKGPDGPIYSQAKVKEFGFTPLQVEEVNKITPRYYRDFLSLERQHTTVASGANGLVNITIAPFRDEAIALAERMVKEIRGTTGKDIVPGGYDLRGVGIVGFLGLFRHEGTREVKAALWKDNAGYHFTEAFGTDKDQFGGERSGGSRTLHGKTWQEAFPEEYWIYWKEPSAAAPASPNVAPLVPAQKVEQLTVRGVAALESRIDAALAIPGDSTRNNSLALLALEAATQGLAKPAKRAIEKITTEELKDDTASKCAQRIAASDLPGAIEIARLIASSEIREVTLAKLAGKR